MEIVGRHLFAAVLTAIAFVMLTPAVQAAPVALGDKTCLECHKAEHAVWSETKHFKSFRTVHKNKKAKAIVKSIGGKSMKKEAACALCHYTSISKKAGKKAKPKAGPSCESCHGASSDWIKIHNDYGGPNAKMADETPAHKVERIAKATAAGMIWSSNHYGIVENCMSCHGLNNDALDGKTLAAMLDADHPLNPDFELVRYSQGSIRHRYYAPDATKNAEMTPAQLSELFVEGQAAKLVSATDALTKSDNAKYQAAQKLRLEKAKAALSAVKSVPEVAALLSAPTRENALKLIEAIKGKDLSAEVGSMIPAKADFK
ncbi:MAG: hypothetical protein HOE62_03320 [Alphaproteobacteria bacterium]|mgnify:FL=1|jgi:hypothetical protein|nr:hypothetical protein [Alphaproteobacteria bacterium]MBT4016956.1 hypothetical protein [Alphaproteobacteria bacterium]MBT4965246.1 hypothetical protein [Alphaproteobacteria bacterium]MBT5162001.1 hypothetical protein [Alphaproteobacteria bacterium]MBT5918621.1 hypothetical protein [Alphaproteobacteria bacterium]